MPRKVLMVVVLTILTGCEKTHAWAEKLREIVRPEEAYSSTLQVDVEPPAGITILLNNKPVATTSPYRGDRLLSGEYILEVRGMGYYPVTLPITLKRRELLKVPVTLRPRVHVEEISKVPSAPKPRPLPEKKEPVATAPVEAKPIKFAIRLEIAAEPQQIIKVDQELQKSNTVLLRYTQGSLNIGQTRLNYAVNNNDVLTFKLEQSCEKDSSKQVRSFQLAQGVTRIVCPLEQGQQVILLKR